MSEFFKSALGYLGNAAASVGQDNEFVGQYVELGERKLHVKKLLAEGLLRFKKGAGPPANIWEISSLPISGKSCFSS